MNLGIPNSVGPIFVGMAIQTADKMLLITSLGQDRAKVLADTKGRCDAAGDAIAVIDFSGTTDMTRAQLADFLAANGVVGTELTDAIRSIAKSMAELIEHTFCGPKDNR